jgi:peroxiredoxin
VCAHSQGHNSVVVGLPDLTPAQEAFVSGYVRDASKLQSAGFQHVYLAAVAAPDEVDAFVQSTLAASQGIVGLSDKDGTFTRMLGLDINAPGTKAPFSQRYIGLVQDGILTRLVSSGLGFACASNRGLRLDVNAAPALCRDMTAI